MRKYKVSKECIACGACVEIATNNFDIGKNNIAYLKKQAENTEEETSCQQALEVCPVEAISSYKDKDITLPDAIIANSNIKETLDKHPELKNNMVKLSPKFKRMQNPTLYKSLARFVNFNDAAKIVGVSVCEILHAMNKHLGTEDSLIKICPNVLRKPLQNFPLK